MSEVAVPLTDVENVYTIVTRVVPPKSNGTLKTLGTIQLLIGLLMLIYEIVKISMTFPYYFFSDVSLWDSFFYIVAGSLAISASKRQNPCVVTATVVLNIFSCIAAAVGITLFSLSLLGTLQNWIIIVLLVVSILDFLISCCICGYACKACNRRRTVNVNVVQNPAEYYPENQEEMDAAQFTSVDSPPMKNPPAYHELYGLAI